MIWLLCIICPVRSSRTITVNLVAVWDIATFYSIRKLEIFPRLLRDFFDNGKRKTFSLLRYHLQDQFFKYGPEFFHIIPNLHDIRIYWIRMVWHFGRKKWKRRYICRRLTVVKGLSNHHPYVFAKDVIILKNKLVRKIRTNNEDTAAIL